MKVKGFISVGLALGLSVSLAFAQGQSEHWVPTWVAAAQRPAQPRTPPATAAKSDAPRPPAPIISLNNQTARMIARTSIGGKRIRVELSNAYNTVPLAVGATHVAIRQKDSAIVPGSDRVLTFSGKPSITIPPGALVMSDPVELDVAPLSDVAVSVYVPGETGLATLHSNGLHTTYISKQGDTTSQPEMTGAATSLAYYWLSGIEVVAPRDAAAFVAFGDSITDGTRSTPNTDSSWPSFFARRLAANPGTAHIAVLNEGIAGNRILRDNIGPAGLARFEKDVLMQPGVKWVSILEGTNDLGSGLGPDFIFAPRPNAPASDNPTADDLTGAYRQFVSMAHTHGVKVIGCTILPFEGAAYYSEGANTVRIAVNQWMKTSGVFDAVVDFDALIKSPENPNKFRAEFDSGDHLHPNDAGYKAMAAAIDLSILSGKKRPASGGLR